MIRREVIIIGAGPAGMAAAVKLESMGFRDLLVLEKEEQPGGVLRQCIHPGFGLIRFGRNLTGPEYSLEYRNRMEEAGIPVCYDTTVLKVRKGEDGGIIITAAGPDGTKEYYCDAAILASGCRERSRGALMIAGTRPAGILTAGTAQGMMNLLNTKVGERVVIIGSGDIGLIMARRFTLEGSRVLCVVEKEDVCGGLSRNRKECLDDFGIPLVTGAQVVRIDGEKRVRSVTIREDDGLERTVECDTVVLSAGLIPEDGFVEGEVPGLFYCGNALYVHDLVDEVSESGEEAAMDAAGFLLSRGSGRETFSRYASEEVPRVRKERRAYVERRKEEKRLHRDDHHFITCIICPNSCRIDLRDLSGGQCPRGEVYARNEKEHPYRILTTTVLTEKGEPVSVRTDVPIPLEELQKGVETLQRFRVPGPVKPGEILLRDFICPGTNLVATKGSTE